MYCYVRHALDTSEASATFDAPGVQDLSEVSNTSNLLALLDFVDVADAVDLSEEPDILNASEQQKCNFRYLAHCIQLI